MELDNNSLLSVKRFANTFKALGTPLNGLILNAGIMFPPFELTKDGIESQFGVNHIAHFALAKDLLEVMKKSSSPATVVSVASLAHWFSVDGGTYLKLDQINDVTKFDTMKWYGQSKLANVLFARELTRRLGPNSHIYVNAVHPGAVRGELNRHMVKGNVLLQWIDAMVQALLYWPETEGALTVLAPAVSPKIIKDNIRGRYFVPIGRLDPGSSEARDDQLAGKLWEFSEQILKEKGWDNLA